MRDKVLTEILAAYADDLNRGKADWEIYPSQVPHQREELDVLLRLTERIKQALVPVQPSPMFVKNLVRQLIVGDKREAVRPTRGYRREMVIGAAAVGSVLSVIGILAYLVKSRTQMKARVVSMG